ncbi:MAG TPA: imidazolonepropionase [Acidimicrobiia bacterium]|nr:imidazolonepropionase [Acidimicrobiia bacterium]
MTSLVITNIGSLITNASGVPGDLGIVDHAALAIDGERIAWVGPESDLPDEHRDAPGLDAAGRAALPGFVDAHTHLVFGGDRSEEFARRLRGESYEDTLAAGGGIHSTVAATREASIETLTDGAAARLQRMAGAGTTTAEVKSGYGLRTADERKILEAATEAGRLSRVDVVPTFLGAHVPERGVDRAEYVDRVVEEMLPECASLARWCDVFCDRGAFTVDDGRRILESARAHGLGLRLHAEQIAHTGAAALAAEMGAGSADHLDHVTAEDAAALREAGVVATLLPAASFSMRSPQAPGRMLWDSGVTVALATDCNPGTSNVESMPLVIALACLEMGLTPEEAVWAATLGGARSLRLDDRGAAVPGALADLAILEAPSYLHIPYRPGTDLMWRVMKRGEWM